MRTASTASFTPATLFREVAPAPPARQRLQPVPAAMVIAAPTRPVDVRRWIDLSLVPAAVGVWLHVLAMMASQL